MTEPADAKKATYVGLGWLTCDCVMELAAYPSENYKVAAKQLFTQAGGPVVRALLLLQRFGQTTRLIGAVGNDVLGKSVLTELQDHGVDTRFTARDAAEKTRVAHVWLASDTGSRTVAYSTMGPEIEGQPDPATLQGAAALLLDGRHPRIAGDLATIAVARGIPVAIDMGSYKDYLPNLLSLAAIIVGPRHTWAYLAEALGYSKPQNLMLHLDQATCVLTDGPEYVMAVHGGRTAEHSPTPVHAVDSNGAGDVFFGAFVWARANSYPITEALRFAAFAAAAKCRRLGNNKLPSLDDIFAEEGRSTAS